MKKTILAVFVSVALGACGGSGSSGQPNTRTYNVAANGDLLVVTVHADTHQIDFEDRTSHGATGTLDYTVGEDGGYRITTPGSNILTVYEAPGRALTMEAKQTRSGGVEPELLLGVAQSPLSHGDVEGKSFNVLQFRTREGGLEVGHLTFAGDGAISYQGYFPAAVLLDPGHEFSVLGGTPVLTDDPATGTFSFEPPSSTDPPSTCFGIAGGTFVMDMLDQTMMGFPEADSADVQATQTGTYRLLAYEKNDIRNVDGVETAGSGPRIVKGTLTVSVDGGTPTVSLLDESGSSMLAPTPLVPFADSELFDPAGPPDGVGATMNGTFVFPSPDGTPVVLVFTDGGVLLGNFSVSKQSADQYNYFYGLALKL